MQNRFEFLEDEFPLAASCGKKAEESLNFDNNICLLNLGRIAENITEILCAVNGVEKLEDLINLEIIEPEIELKIKTLIEIKNDAEKNNYDSETAAERLMTTARELCEWFILKQVKNKFDFLAELFPPDFISPLVNIAEIGREAEKNLNTNTRYCLICLGDIGEAIADYLINANNISAQRDHLDKINVLFNMDVIKEDTKNKLHNLRISRNNAVHERYNNTYTSEEEAAKLLDEVLELCRWLFKLVMKPSYIVKGRISEINEDSISVLIGQIPAEVPLNEIPADENGNSLKNSYVKGKKYIFKVLENENDKIILSLNDAEQEYKSKVSDIKRQYSKYKTGQEVNAKILRINNSSGAFVELKNGLQALIPSNEIIARQLYSTDSTGTKHIKYEVKARVKSINPSQYPPMILTLRENRTKIKTRADNFSKSDSAPKMNDLEFIELCKRAKADTILKALDKRGADPNAKNNNNLTALMEAARYNHHSVIKLLLDAGANINAKNQQGNTALHFAAMQNGSNAVEELIKNGADIDAVNKNNKKPIDYARANKKLNDFPNIIELLKNKKTESNPELEIKNEIKNENQNAEINLAIQPDRDNLESESLNVQNNEGVTTLEIAKNNKMDKNALYKKDFLKICRSGSSVEIAEAVAAGANVNARNKALSSALMFAARSNTAEAVAMLIEGGAYIDAQDIYGNTALIYAASENNDDVVELLIDAGADIELANTAGFSAYDYGRKNYRLTDTEAIKRLVRNEE